MSLRAHAYLSDTWNRDKVMGIAQFLPMFLEGPVKNSGCEALAMSLGSLSKMAEAYRAVTRLSFLFNALAPSAFRNQSHPKKDANVWRMDQLAAAIHVIFCVNDNTAALAGNGVIPKTLSRLGGIAVLCWLYNLMINFVRQTYLLIKHNPSKKQEGDVVPYTCDEAKHAVVNLVKTGSFAIFALSCLPEGKPQLLDNVTGPLMPLHHLIMALAPKKLELCDTSRGLFGLIGAVCDFY